MAKATVVTCDLCFDPTPLDAPKEAVLDGIALDLCREHSAIWDRLSQKAVRGAQSPKRSATKTTSNPTKPRKVQRPNEAKEKEKAKASAKNKDAPPVDSSAVRAWARANNLEVPARGPLKQSLVDAFLESTLNNYGKPPRPPRPAFSAN